MLLERLMMTTYIIRDWGSPMMLIFCEVTAMVMNQMFVPQPGFPGPPGGPNTLTSSIGQPWKIKFRLSVNNLVIRKLIHSNSKCEEDILLVHMHQASRDYKL